MLLYLFSDYRSAYLQAPDFLSSFHPISHLLWRRRRTGINDQAILAANQVLFDDLFFAQELHTIQHQSFFYIIFCIGHRIGCCGTIIPLFTPLVSLMSNFWSKLLESGTGPTVFEAFVPSVVRSLLFPCQCSGPIPG